MNYSKSKDYWQSDSLSTSVFVLLAESLTFVLEDQLINQGGFKVSRWDIFCGHVKKFFVPEQDSPFSDTVFFNFLLGRLVGSFLGLERLLVHMQFRTKFLHLSLLGCFIISRKLEFLFNSLLYSIELDIPLTFSFINTNLFLVIFNLCVFHQQTLGASCIA